MSPTQSHSDGTHFPIKDDHDGYAHAPQQPRAPSYHASMSTGLVWNQNVGNFSFTSANDDASGEHGLDQHLNRAHDSEVTSPYAVQRAYPSPSMQHHGFPAGSPFGTMHAGTDAGQGQTFTGYQSETDPSLLQVQHMASGMTVIGFEPNNNNNNNLMDQNHFIGTLMPLPHGQPNPAAAASFANGHGRGHGHATNGNPHPQAPVAQPNDIDIDIEPPSPAANNSNLNGWTDKQDDLVRRLKHQKKKVAEIKEQLETNLGVERSENAISKRWKIIKKRDSRDEAKTVLQNVMRPFVRLFNAALVRAFPRNHGRQGHHDPQVSAVMLSEEQPEVREHFEKGLTKLVEECVLMLQRGGSRSRHGGRRSL
ncbi:hypothetical protein QBC32DRAFT_212756 [Pseudoneurospora amorphoporcata]|uniref:Uncharacterized protein n=1 Tax=Pseudoneurospora amorphoporcata TaxID=241081 RepID=A0AAN6NYR2_9PEZI|nr:hypothetical protein QBC32DRAFT_212756 [Pseudoneurospora amorphoporcata]